MEKLNIIKWNQNLDTALIWLYNQFSPHKPSNIWVLVANEMNKLFPGLNVKPMQCAHRWHHSFAPNASQVPPYLRKQQQNSDSQQISASDFIPAQQMPSNSVTNPQVSTTNFGYGKPNRVARLVLPEQNPQQHQMPAPADTGRETLQPITELLSTLDEPNL